jgi:hypothetical protein
MSYRTQVTCIIMYVIAFVFSFFPSNYRVDVYVLLAVVGALFSLSNKVWVRRFSIAAVICALIFLRDAHDRDIKTAKVVGKTIEHNKLREVLERKGIILDKVENELPEK